MLNQTYTFLNRNNTTNKNVLILDILFRFKVVNINKGVIKLYVNPKLTISLMVIHICIFIFLWLNIINECVNY